MNPISLFNPWVLLGLLAALLASGAGGLWAGIRIESNSRDAAEKVAIQSMHDAYVSKVGEYRGIAQQTSKEFQDATTQRQTDAISFREQLRRAQASGKELVRCPKPSDPAGTGIRLTGAFVGLYDRALEIGVSRPGDPGRVDAPDTGAADVDPAEVLAVHADNAEAWAECRDIARGWQSLARKYGWVR